MRKASDTQLRTHPSPVRKASDTQLRTHPSPWPDTCLPPGSILRALPYLAYLRKDLPAGILPLACPRKDLPAGILPLACPHKDLPAGILLLACPRKDLPAGILPLACPRKDLPADILLLACPRKDLPADRHSLGSSSSLVRRAFLRSYATVHHHHALSQAEQRCDPAVCHTQHQHAQEAGKAPGDQMEQPDIARVRR